MTEKARSRRKPRTAGEMTEEERETHTRNAVDAENAAAEAAVRAAAREAAAQARAAEKAAADAADVEVQEQDEASDQAV